MEHTKFCKTFFSLVHHPISWLSFTGLNLVLGAVFSSPLIFDDRRYRMITFYVPSSLVQRYRASRCLANTISVSPDKGCVHRTEKQTHFSRADFIPYLIRLLRSLYLQLKRFTTNDKENLH